jgi:hypothetical protein
VSGVPKTGVQVQQGASWWKYVPPELQEQLHEMELDAQFLAREWSEGKQNRSTQEVIYFRRALNAISKECFQRAEVGILQELRSQFPNHTLCWRVLKKLRCPEPTVAIDVGTLQGHFSSIFHRRDRPLFIVEDLREGWGKTRDGEAHLDEPFTDSELQKALRDLNGQAGTGPGRIPSQAIKEVFMDDDSRAVLLLLVNLCFQSGTIPTPWGMAELFVLFKGKGLPTLADNYRAIALSDDFRRVYERLIQGRLSTWSYLNNATGSMQFGFRRGVGTVEAIFVLRTFMLYVTRVLQVPGFAVFIDIRKAFPSMSRPKIVETMRKHCVPANLTRAIASLLSGSTQRLKVNGKLTEPFTVTTGTPEGSINSPEIFAVVYKDLLEQLDIHPLPADPRDIIPGRVYYIIFADDLSFFTLEIRALPPSIVAFKAACEPADMATNDGKTKWMAFLPPNPVQPPVFSEWQLCIDGTELENVDEFSYLGFRLDCRLTDDAHVEMLNERYIRAAKVTGKLMRDLKCSNLVNLRKFFVSMVFSQLYGLIFVDAGKIDFEQGVGIFLRTSLGLPESFPNVVAVSLLGLKHVRVFQAEQRVKFLVRWEMDPGSPVFNSLLVDRAFLFPAGEGLNAGLGTTLVEVGFSRTLNYRTHFTPFIAALASKSDSERRGRLLATEGRAFWTELGHDALLPIELKQTASRLSYENNRILFLLLADMLCWSALKKPTRKCSHCNGKFTTHHFFTCSKFFVGEHGWKIFVSLCRAESWEDLIDFIFHVLGKWVTESAFFKPAFRLNVLEFTNLCDDPIRGAFRWNV